MYFEVIARPRRVILDTVSVTGDVTLFVARGKLSEIAVNCSTTDIILVAICMGVSRCTLLTTEVRESLTVTACLYCRLSSAVSTVRVCDVT